MEKSTPCDRSPLRYPGGKSKAIGALRQYLPSSVTEICSPFFGGGSLEIALAKSGVMVHGYDLYGPLVTFWKMLLTQKEALADAVLAYLPLEKQRFYHLQAELPGMDDPLQAAAVFFVLNRSSFSGSTSCGGMSTGHPRFTKSAIDRLRHFDVTGFTVDQIDFEKSIRQHPDTLLYLDPPYAGITEPLYGHRGSMHKRFPHEKLADILKNRQNWILSYNDHPEIRGVYSDYRIDTPQWAYGMSQDKSSREIVILSHDLAQQVSNHERACPAAVQIPLGIF